MTQPANQVPGQLFQDDPFGKVRKEVIDPAPPPQDVKAFHKRCDRNSSTLADHHTLGPDHNQAAGGDHIHDGVSSKKLMEGTSITGAKGGNVALANLITALAAKFGFTDSTT